VSEFGEFRADFIGEGFGGREGGRRAIGVNLIWLYQVIVGLCRLESVATSFDFRLMIDDF
jgi:hypothetical protein